MIINYKDKEIDFYDRCVISYTAFEKLGINCFSKIPLDDRLEPDVIKLFPKERYATLYRSVLLSDYIMLNSTYEQISVMTVKVLSMYSYDLLNTLYEKFKDYTENTTEYLIDEYGTIYKKDDAEPLYKKIEMAITEKDRKKEKTKKIISVVENANKHLDEADYVYKPASDTRFLLNIAELSYIRLKKEDDYLKTKKVVTLQDLLIFLNNTYTGEEKIEKFERLYKRLELEERYDYKYRGFPFVTLIKENIPSIPMFSIELYRESDVLKLDEIMYKRYGVKPVNL